MSCRRFLATSVVLMGLGSVAFAQPSVQDIVNQVSQSQYTHYLSDNDFLYTQSGDNRSHGTAQWQAAQTNVLDTFAGLGLSASIDTGWANVVATKPGTVTPNNIYIVGAHYDSAGTPGADDNASGVAGVLEAARVLSQYQFQSTLVFVAFDGEETGLNGSKQYASAAKARGDNILGMLDLDMIAAPGGENGRADIYGQPTQDAIRQTVADALQTYGGISSTIIDNPYPLSDHVPFETNGYQACMAIEYNPFGNSSIHTANDYVDKPSYIDYGYATSMVRGSVGWLAQMRSRCPSRVRWRSW